MQLVKQHTLDLHCHTRYSDGSLGVMELVKHFAEFGVTEFAITDHDSLGAHTEWARNNEGMDCTVIPGIEISCSALNREVHVIGLNVDIHNPDLTHFVQKQQSNRRERLLAYAEKLEKLGIPGVIDAVKRLSSEAVTRTHLSQILVSMGVVPDAQRAFKRYIGRKAKAYIPMQWPEIERVVEVITQAGGVAVLAHPARYPLARKQLEQLIEDFSDAGGKGIELSYPNADPQITRWLVEKALCLKLYGSQGSDFHNPEWRWVKPGVFPPLPATVEPVWRLWKDK